MNDDNGYFVFARTCHPRWLLACLLWSQVTYGAGAWGCGRALRALGARVAAELADRARRPVETAGLVLTGAAYPLVSAGVVAYEARRMFSAHGRRTALRQSLEWFQDSWPGALSFLAWHALGLGGAITQPAFVDETRDMEAPRDDDVVVLVNTSVAGSVDYRVTEAFFDSKYAGRRAVVRINPRTHLEMVEQLKKIAADRGPVTKLDLYGHGFPGGLAFPVHGNGIQDTPRADGIFANDAKVRVMSCFTGHGETGDDFMRAFGRTFLTRGGEIATSQVVMQADYTDALNARLGLGLPESGKPLVNGIYGFGLPGLTAAAPAMTNARTRFVPWEDLYVFRNRVKRMTFAP